MVRSISNMIADGIDTWKENMKMKMKYAYSETQKNVLV